jgi:hypothetical protein
VRTRTPTMSTDDTDWEMAQILHPTLSYPTNFAPSPSPDPSQANSVTSAELYRSPRNDLWAYDGSPHSPTNDNDDDYGHLGLRSPSMTPDDNADRQYDQPPEPSPPPSHTSAPTGSQDEWPTNRPSTSTVLLIGAPVDHDHPDTRGGLSAATAAASIRHHLAVSNTDHASIARTSRALSLITRYPVADIPPILFSSPATHFIGLAPRSIDEWASHPGPKIFLHIFNIRSGLFVDDRDAFNEYMTLKVSIILASLRFLTQDDDIAVIIPRPDDQFRLMRFHNRSFLLTMKNENTVATLLAMKVVSLDSTTVAFFPFSIDMPTLAIRLSGFNPHTTEADVTSIVTNRWRAEPTRSRIAPILAHYLDAKVPSVSGRTLDSWTNTIRVVKYPCQNDATFSILVDPPTRCADHFALFRRIIRNTLYNDPSHRNCGTGHVANFTYCVNCGGNDHPVGLCLFYKMPGWSEPRPRETADAMQTDEHLGGGNIGWCRFQDRSITV